MKTILFSGFTWYIKSGLGKGPGGNNWHEHNVYVDSSGYLHLRIIKIDGLWYCAEIFSKDIAKSGNYTFYLASNVEKLDRNMVVGLFLYENDHKEIDIEFFNGESFYCVQPNDFHTFRCNLNGSHSSHSLDFLPTVSFRSFHGHSEDYPIEEWTSKSGSSHNLPNAHLHINFWLKDGAPPENGAEIIIEKVVFK